MARFNYSTDEKTIKEIKQFALDNNTNANEILDMSFRFFKLLNDVNNFDMTVADLLCDSEDFARLCVNVSIKDI